MNVKKREIDMCNGPILGKILLFAIPLMFSGILQLLFNAADIVVVGHFSGSRSLAAVGSTTSLINLIVNLFIGMATGTNVVIARLLGAQKEKDVREAVHTAIFLSLVAGVFLIVLGEILMPQILIWMSTPEDVMDLTLLYLRIYFLGMPVVMLYNFGNAIMRAAGDTKRPLYYLSGAGVVNVLLNLFFVIILKLDVAGVALATILSQSISAGLILRCLMREEGALHFSWKELRVSPDKLRQILRIGIPAGLQGCVFSLSNVVIQSSINSFGSVVMAGSSASSNIESFQYAALNSFHQAAISFSSQNLGAGKPERIKKTAVCCLTCAVVLGLGISVLLVAFAPQLIRIYTTDAPSVAAGVTRMRCVCLFYFLCNAMDVMAGCMRGLGYSVTPMLVSTLGACGTRILWVATIFQKYRTIGVLYISYPVSWAITFAAHLICYIVVWKRREGEKRKPRPAV